MRRPPQSYSSIGLSAPLIFISAHPRQSKHLFTIAMIYSESAHNNDQMIELQNESKQLTRSIHLLAGSLSRHDRIRLKLWLDKLDKPISNSVWKQNRNLYLKALRQMVQEGSLQTPFHQTPPEGPLPKISLYDIPYPIRIKISDDEQRIQSKTASCHKKSLSVTSKQNEKRSLSKNSKKMEHKKRISFDSVRQEDLENIPYLSNFKNQTMRTEELHHASEASHLPRTQKIHFTRQPLSQTQQRAMNLLRNTLKFLSDHEDDLDGQVAYKELIEKIMKCGQEFGEELEGKVEIERANQRIKENLLRGDLNSMEFLSYLDSLH